MQAKFKYNSSKKFDKEYDKFNRYNQIVTNKIDQLISEILENPRMGKGNPERLRHQTQEIWSRRIDQKNRLVYIITEDAVYFESCTGHYGDH